MKIFTLHGEAACLANNTKAGEGRKFNPRVLVSGTRHCQILSCRRIAITNPRLRVSVPQRVSSCCALSVWEMSASREEEIVAEKLVNEGRPTRRTRQAD
jgi:hypothetical protein